MSFYFFLLLLFFFNVIWWSGDLSPYIINAGKGPVFNNGEGGGVTKWEGGGACKLSFTPTKRRVRNVSAMEAQ